MLQIISLPWHTIGSGGNSQIKVMPNNIVSWRNPDGVYDKIFSEDAPIYFSRNEMDWLAYCDAHADRACNDAFILDKPQLTEICADI